MHGQGIDALQRAVVILNWNSHARGRNFFKYELCSQMYCCVEIVQMTFEITEGNQRAYSCSQTTHVQGYTQKQVK